MAFHPAGRAAGHTLTISIGVSTMNAKIFGAVALALVLSACGGKKEEAAPAPEAAPAEAAPAEAAPAEAAPAGSAAAEAAPAGSAPAAAPAEGAAPAQ